MSKRNLFIISISDRPLGTYRIGTSSSAVRIPTVPLEFVQKKLDQLIGENPVYQRDARSGILSGYIQDALAALDIIKHAMFLYVESPLNFRGFLSEYGTVPDQCPVCHDEIEFLDADERLEHIIQCKWLITRSVSATVVKQPESPSWRH